MRTSRSDADLLREARNDAAAFGAFYRTHATWVERWLRGQVRDPHVAADLTGETFAQALVSLHRFRGREPGEGTAWLFGIARNLLRGYFARREVETQARDRLGVAVGDYGVDEFAAADDRLDASALADEIAAALGSLPPRLQETLELRALEGLPYGEIGARTGTTAANARVRVARAARAAATRLANRRESVL